MTTSEKSAPELITVPNSNIAEGTPSETVAVPETVGSIIAEARSHVADEEYVPVVYCSDVLLDCWNAAEGPTVRAIVGALLPDFSNGNIRKRDDFTSALDEISMALVTNAAFDEVRDS